MCALTLAAIIYTIFGVMMSGAFEHNTLQEMNGPQLFTIFIATSLKSFLAYLLPSQLFHFLSL